MKKIISISIIILGLATQVMSQQLKVTSYLETTSVSPKLGVAISRVSEYGIEYGGFYQESEIMESLFMGTEDTAALPRFYEQTFYGLFFQHLSTNLLSSSPTSLPPYCYWQLFGVSGKKESGGSFSAVS